jgi:hypothetical protein
VELFKGEYVSTIVLPIERDIFGNWIYRHMCGDYCLVNKYTCLDKYAMPLLKEIFDVVG